MESLPGAEPATYLVQDLGAEPDLCQLVVEGISDRAWKPRSPVRLLWATVKGETKSGKGPAWPLPRGKEVLVGWDEHQVGVEIRVLL